MVEIRLFEERATPGRLHPAAPYDRLCCLAKKFVLHTSSMLLWIANSVSIPGRVFFYSEEYGNGNSHSLDSWAPGNDVYYEGLMKEKI